MAETGVSGADKSERSGGAQGAEDKSPTTEDRAEVGKAADAVDADAVTAEAATVGDKPAGPTDGVDAVAAVEAKTTPPVEEAAPAPTNPAGFLADKELSQAQMEERLAEMSPTEVKDVITGLDQADMGYGAKVTEQGWAALDADINHRYSEAAKARDWTNPELAELSVEVTRNADKLGSYAEKSWRDVAHTMTAVSRDPKHREAHQNLAKARELAGHYVNGGRPLPADMSNRQLLDSVKDIPGMKAFGDIMSLSGVGMIASFAAEGKANERLAELDARINDGRMGPVDVDRMTHSDLARGVGTAVLAAEVIDAVHPKGWVRDGAAWVAQRARDLKDLRLEIDPSVVSANGLGGVKITKGQNWGNWKSTPTFGHAFSDHGAKVRAQSLIDRAHRKGHQIGQFTDNQAAADFIAGAVKGKEPGAYDIPIGDLGGRGFLPDGTEVVPDMVRVVVKPNGSVRTAFPYSSAHAN